MIIFLGVRLSDLLGHKKPQVLAGHLLIRSWV